MQLMEIRTSERSTWKRCPQAWYYGYVRELEPLRPANPLWFGSAIHAGLASYYIPGKKRGPHPLEATLEALDEVKQIIVVDEDGEGEYVKAQDLAKDMIEGYLEKWGDDDFMDVIAPEKTFQAVLRSADRRFKFRYVGTFDLTYRDQRDGNINILETKTAASIRTNHLALDEQNGTYITFGERVLRRQGLIGDNDRVTGVLYNFLRKAMRDTRPKNEDGLYTNKPTKQHFVDAILNELGQDGEPGEVMEQWAQDLPKLTLAKLQDQANSLGLDVLGDVSKVQPPESFVRSFQYRSMAQRRRQVQRIREEALYMERMRSGDPGYPIWKKPSQDCSRCAFFNPCQLDENGDMAEVEDYLSTMYRHWDPYEAHHKPANTTEE